MTAFVLVHEAGTGGWLWDDVAGLLRSAGHEAEAPSLSGITPGPSADNSIGLADHVTEVTEVARGWGWTIRELPTGHFSMVTMPRALTELLLAAS